MVGLNANANNRLRAELRQQEHPGDGGQEQPGRPGHRGHAAGAAVRRARAARRRSAGAARTSSAWPRRSPSWSRTSKYAPFAARGGVMDGERLTRRAGRAGQQVAQPQRAVEHPAGPDPQPGRQAGQPVDLGRRGAGQPDRAEGRRRRRSSRKQEDGHRRGVTTAKVAVRARTDCRSVENQAISSTSVQSTAVPSATVPQRQVRRERIEIVDGNRQKQPASFPQ